MVPGVASALDQINNENYDFVWLDVRLGPDTGLVVADKLQAENKPSGFLTGYGELMRVEDRFANIPIMCKPSGIEDLSPAMQAAIVC